MSAGRPAAATPRSASTRRSPAPRLVVAGHPRHGVARYAALIARALPRAEVLWIEDVRRVAGAVAGGGPVHLHVTDRLWGDSPEAAAERVLSVAAVTPVTVTLHDVPQPSDGPANLARRAAAYGRIAAAARAVAVCSAHEARLLAAHVPEAPIPRVIPHALDVQPPTVSSHGFAGVASRAAAVEDSVAVLGFVYPGKGHEAVIDAVGALPAPRPSMVALGAPSPGHERDVDALTARAAAAGVRFTLTGHVPDAELPAALRRAGVPVAAHAHLSASGSIATWGGAGRRPLVLDGPYARELAALRPDAVTLVAPDRLGAAIAGARRDPSSTWTPSGADLGPTLADTAAAHVAWWRELAVPS